jgi:hypothetical protein
MIVLSQTYHKLTQPEMYHIMPESPEHHYALGEVAKEAATFLSPACCHPHLVQLLGVVVDHRQRPIKLLFERAELGDLEGFVSLHIQS